MRLLSKLAIGGGAVSVVTAGALVIGEVFATSATLVAVDPGAPPARADSLAPFDDCDQLLAWYIDHNVSEVGPYGWGGPIMYAMDQRAFTGLSDTVPQAAALASGNAARQAAVGSSTTGTNTQEVDVDEPDVAKTDGKLLVRLTRPHGNDSDQMLAVSDVTGAEKNTLGRLHLPHASYDSQLLLVGTHVVVTQSAGGYGNPIAFDGGVGIGRPMPILANSAASTRVLDIDVSDPAHPRLVGTDVYSGSLISARQYGDTVRIVTDTGRPELHWRMPGARFSAAQATAWNRKLVRKSTLSDWLPSVRHAGQKQRLLGCSDVMRPKTWSGSDTVTVTTFKAGAPEDRSAVGVTAAGGIVYSSAQRLYVASTEWQGSGVHPGPRMMRPNTVTTDVHAFALDGLQTTYVGSGHIDGSIRDRWSLDEYDGYLRVAWTNQDTEDGVQNGISVLKERDHTLQEVGTLDGLGVNENIQSVRWFDDLAVVVTFQQIDPLYTIDLSDPTSPRELGALKIPGYSGYLHPIGHNLLLGLGVGGGGREFGGGAQAAVFDISNLRKPVQVSRIGFGPGTYLQALDDPRSFTWLPGASTGLTPVAEWGYGHDGNRLHVDAMSVDQHGVLHRRTVAQLDEGWQPRILPLADGRVAIVDGFRVQLVSVS